MMIVISIITVINNDKYKKMYIYTIIYNKKYVTLKLDSHLYPKVALFASMKAFLK